jgi:CO/xanthine dehydrogenase Mo-binding subunit
MPYDVGTGALATPTIYDSGRYGELFERALERFDLAAARQAQVDARAGGRLVGIGMGCFVEKSGLGPWEYARLELEGDGRFTLYSGCASVGQGMETVLAQVCAQELGTAVEEIRVIHGDTERVPRGIGAFASRGTVMAGSSAHLAAVALGARLRQAAAERLETAVEDLEMRPGAVAVKGSPGRAVSLVELARFGAGAADEVGGEQRWLEEATFESSHMAYPYGVHLCLVEVDRDTGHVSVPRYLVAYDVGRAVNPMLVQGQIVGGVAQGVGGALLEDFVYDANGQPQAATFMDYLLPSMHEVPEIEVLLREDAPSPLNPLGVKGAGEGGAVGVGAAIANAVADALAPLGVVPTELLLSPGRLRELIRSAGG